MAYVTSNPSWSYTAGVLGNPAIYKINGCEVVGPYQQFCWSK